MKTKSAGERVMGLLRRLCAKLRLQANESKSAVDLAWNRKILGYSSWALRDESSNAGLQCSASDVLFQRGGARID